MLVSNIRYCLSYSLVNCTIGQDDLRQERSQAAFHREATTHMNTANQCVADATHEYKITGEGSHMDYLEAVTYLTRGSSCMFEAELRTYSFLGILQLSTRNMDDALRTFDGVLSKKPTNLVALLGKVSPMHTPMYT